jgi:hypothetical protein
MTIEKNVLENFRKIRMKTYVERFLKDISDHINFYRAIFTFFLSGKRYYNNTTEDTA